MGEKGPFCERPDIVSSGSTDQERRSRIKIDLLSDILNQNSEHDLIWFTKTANLMNSKNVCQKEKLMTWQASLMKDMGKNGG